jgi:hypothetical protein
MARVNKILVSGLLVGAFALVSIPALAQPAGGGGGGGGGAAAAGASGGSSSGGDYGYKFDDDPLSAGGFGPNDARIQVRPQAARTTLIRPRTSFVQEMLKSVENI